MSTSNVCTHAECSHSHGISRNRIRYLFKQHWAVSQSQQSLVAPDVAEVTHYFGTRPISWMGPLVAERRMSPFRDSISKPNLVATGCGISEIPDLIFQRDHPVSRGSRAEYLYKQHWLHSKVELEWQKHDDTRSLTSNADECKVVVEIDFCGQKTLKKGTSLQSISELGVMNLESHSLDQERPLESNDSINAPSTHLLENADMPRRVGHMLSELGSKNIKMEADLVLLADHGKVCCLQSNPFQN